jgi:hypothetical protein
MRKRGRDHDDRVDPASRALGTAEPGFADTLASKQAEYASLLIC